MRSPIHGVRAHCGRPTCHQRIFKADFSMRPAQAVFVLQRDRSRRPSRQARTQEHLRVTMDAECAVRGTRD